MSGCSNCTTLAQIIQKQQVEIAMLRRVIAEAKGACNQIATESSWVMTRHGSPYKYNLAKGAKEAAQDIEKRLK